MGVIDRFVTTDEYVLTHVLGTGLGVLVAILLCLVGNVLLGIAVWRSSSLPRWAGALWLVAALLTYPFGIVLGALTTGARRSPCRSAPPSSPSRAAGWSRT
jgi:hypothetical protein